MENEFFEKENEEMGDYIKRFFEDLDAGRILGHVWNLEDQSEEMSALLVMNLMIDHGVSPLRVLCYLRGGGLEPQDGDAQILASFRDKNKREKLIDAIRGATPYPLA